MKPRDAVVRPPPRRGIELRFVLGFCALATVFEFVFVGFIDQTVWYERYLALNAHGAEAILNLCRVPAESMGSSLFLDSSVVAVKRGCDPTEPFVLFAIAALLFPASRRRKILGVIAAFLFLQALNLVRIASLLLFHRYRPEFFLTAHLSVWPVAIIVFTLAGWILWALGGRASRG